MKPPEPGRKRPHILAAISAVIPTTIIYILRPLQAMAERGEIEFTFISQDKVTPRMVHSSDIIVFSRNDNYKFLNILQEAHAFGIPTVYDIDDSFWDLPTDIWIGKYYRSGRRIETIEHYLKNVSLVRAFSKRLYQKVAKDYTRSVILATPCIDFSLTPTQPIPRQDQILRMVYATGRTYDDPLYPIFLPAVQRLLTAYPDRLEMYFYGGIPPELLGFRNAHWMPVEYDYAAYLSKLGASRYDIGLAPMLDENFYLSKTDTKFRDYAACWIAGVYSDVEPYASVQDGRTGFKISNESDAWEAALRKLIMDEDLRTTIQHQAHDYVYEHYRQELMEQDWRKLISRLMHRHPDRTVSEMENIPMEQNTRPLQQDPQIQTLLENLEILRSELQEQEEIAVRMTGERDQILFAFNSQSKDNQELIQEKNQLQAQIDSLQEQIRELRDSQIAAGEELKNKSKEIERLTQTVSELLEQASVLQQLRIDIEHEHGMAVQRAIELDLMRRRKVIRWIGKLFDRSSLEGLIGSPYQKILDDSRLINPNLNGFLLQPSENLQHMVFLPYSVKLGRINLKSIEIAPILDCTHRQGRIGVELVSPQGQIILNVSVPAKDASETQPLIFHFPPFACEAGTYEVRIFGQELVVPFRVFEWRHYSVLGLGKIQRLPFIGLGFSS